MDEWFKWNEPVILEQFFILHADDSFAEMLNKTDNQLLMSDCLVCMLTWQL